jgi:hypothetical protein
MIARFLYILHLFLNHGISKTGYLFPCSQAMAWRYLTQLGPTEEANPATGNASAPFQQRMETNVFAEVAISVWKQAYGQGPET